MGISVGVAPVAVGVALGAYLLGSVPWGFLMVKMREGRDIRASGSGNIGATNVARTSGPVLGAVVLVLDAAKGVLAVWLASRYGITLMAVAAVAVVLGHMYPVWLRFKGGKGVATGVGAFAMICWPAVAAAFVIWIGVVAIWRYVSLGSILAAATLPILVYGVYLSRPEQPPVAVSLGTTLIAALIIVKHRDNIRRLVAGSEHRLNLRKRV